MRYRDLELPHHCYMYRDELEKDLADKLSEYGIDYYKETEVFLAGFFSIIEKALVEIKRDEAI